MTGVVVIGDGASGQGAAKLAAALDLPCAVVRDGPGAVLPPGGVIVVSPGVHPGRSPLYRAALASGVPVISEMEFGFRHWHKPLLAVTGTNGKTTTTELTVHLLRECGVNAEAVGNIGRPLSDLAAAPGDTDVAVAEVSSFQLERVDTFAPLAAVILNFASDHLDRYPGGFAEYCSVKERIFTRVKPENRIRGLSFADCPRRITCADGRLFLDGKEIFNLAEGDLPGPHNAENAAAACELALRVLPEPLVRSERFAAALRGFRRSGHRIETVLVRNGVTYVDDSKGTNPAAVLAAVDSFSAPLVILLGGLGKGMDFSVLASRAHRFRTAVLYGADRERLAAVLRGKCPIVECGNDFPAVVRSACESARPGDVVLLSPACASMDMFKNYAERGDRFRELAEQLAR